MSNPRITAAAWWARGFLSVMVWGLSEILAVLAELLDKAAEKISPDA